jgi:hypothetical protein
MVERTFAWLCHNRRMSKDYERLCVSGEAFVYIAMTRLMVRRLPRLGIFKQSLMKFVNKGRKKAEAATRLSAPSRALLALSRLRVALHRDA